MHILLIVGGAILLLFLTVKYFGPNVDRALETAFETKMLTDLETALGLVSDAKQPTAYNRAIRQLWDAYERDMAAALVRKFAEARPGDRIVQYWIDQVRSVEPELAERMFEQDFLDRYFHPEVAQTCGSFG